MCSWQAPVLACAEKSSGIHPYDVYALDVQIDNNFNRYYI